MLYNKIKLNKFHDADLKSASVRCCFTIRQMKW